MTLIEQGHAGKKYLLSGPQSLTQKHQVELIGSAIGRDLRFEPITDDEARKQLTALMPPFVIERLLEIWRASVAKPALVTDTVKKVTGSEPTTFQQWAADHSRSFSRESLQVKRNIPKEIPPVEAKGRQRRVGQLVVVVVEGIVGLVTRAGY